MNVNDLPPGKATIEQQAAENAGLFLAGRLLTALLGTGTIWVLFALGNRMFGKATGLLAALLYDVTPTDLTTLAVVTGFLMTVAALASLIPAQWITRIDPMVALRTD